MNMRTLLRFRTVVCTVSLFSGLAIAPLANAQQAKTAPAAKPATANQPAAKPAGDDDETVHLDIFEVTGRAKDNDYMQTETTTGTRVATKINDLPFQVETITSEFMADFDILSVSGDEMAGVISGLSDVTSEGNFTLRGVETLYSLRDGFYRLGLIDRSNTDSIQIIKGPAAAMYGQTMPSGMVNYVSKRPKNQNAEKIILTTYTGGYIRGEFQDNHRLNASGTLLNILTGAAYQSPSWQNSFGYNHTYSLYDGLVWKINPMTQVFASVEWAKIIGVDPSYYSSAGCIFTHSPTDPVQDVRIGTIAQLNKPLLTFSQRGAASYKNRELFTPSIVLEHRFSQIFSGRIAGYYYYRRSPQQGTNTTGYQSGSNAYGPYIIRGTKTSSAGAFMPGGTVNLGNNGSEYTTKLDQFGGAVQTDLTAFVRFSLFGSQASSRTVLMVDANANRRTRLQKKMSDNRFRQLVPLGYTGGTVYLNNPDYNYITPSTMDYASVSRNDDTSYYDLGLNLREQLFLFNERLRIFAGFRYDYLHFNNTFGSQYVQTGDGNSTYAAYSSTAPPVAKSGYNDVAPGKPMIAYTDVFSDRAWLPNIGFNYQVFSWVAPYWSFSESFTPNSQNSQMGNAIIPDERGRGIDYGFKFNFLDQKLWLTVGGYWMNRQHVKTVGNAGSSADLVDFYDGGTYRSQGLEMDLNWRVTPSIQLLGSYSYCDTKIVKNPATQYIVGHRTPGIPLDGGNISFKYKFPAPLAGLSLMVRADYTGRSFPVTTNTTAVLDDWRVPSYGTMNIGFSYQFKITGMTSSITHTLRATMKNIFDRIYIDKKGNYQGQGRIFVFSYTAAF